MYVYSYVTLIELDLKEITECMTLQSQCARKMQTLEIHKYRRIYVINYYLNLLLIEERSWDIPKKNTPPVYRCTNLEVRY